jgi:exosortase family protein XrtG
MTKYLILIPVLIIWLYLLHVCAKAKLPFWHFFIGSVGLFILLVIYARPVLTDPMARAVAEIASIFGSITGVFRANFKYGVILIGNAKEVISMQIDFECSGILEMIVFVSVMAFFQGIYCPGENNSRHIGSRLYYADKCCKNNNHMLRGTFFWT